MGLQAKRRLSTWRASKVGTVHDIPDRMRREWGVIERQLRQEYAALRGEPAELEHVLAVMRPQWDRFARPQAFEPPKSADEAVRLVNDWVQGLVGALLFTLMLREIELYRLRGSGPVGTDPTENKRGRGTSALATDQPSNDRQAARAGL